MASKPANVEKKPNVFSRLKQKWKWFPSKSSFSFRFGSSFLKDESCSRKESCKLRYFQPGWCFNASKRRGTSKFVAKSCIVVGKPKQRTLRHYRRHAPRTESDDRIRRWCPHRWSHADHHYWKIEGNASRKETLWRPDWASNPQCKGPGRWIASRWRSDTGVGGAVAYWIWSDCHLFAKRSWSRSKRGNPCTGLPSS